LIEVYGCVAWVSDVSVSDDGAIAEVELNGVSMVCQMWNTVSEMLMDGTERVTVCNVLGAYGVSVTVDPGDGDPLWLRTEGIH